MSPIKVLVVDDEVELERLITQRFREKIAQKEMSFLFATNGFSALEILGQDKSIDVVLTDINMPGMDGLTLLSEIPKLDENLRAVVVSAYGDIPKIREAMNRGAFDFITKPIDFHDLSITINKTASFVQQARTKQLQLQQALGQLRHQAFYDQLTGLANHHLLLGRLALALEESEYFALLFIKIAPLQSIKYGLGHKVQEKVLLEVSQRLQTCLPSCYTIAKVGADEFAVLINNDCTLSEVKAVADLLHRTFSQPVVVNGSVLFAQAYIGIVDNSLDYETPEELLQAADLATHYAGQQGVGTTTVFDRKMLHQTLERLQWEADLQRAVINQQFYLRYQPIIALDTGRVVGFEALLRWQHPQKGEISPGEFIDLAEKTGLILPLGEWALATACSQLCQWQQQFNDPNLTVSINFSSQQMLQFEIVNIVERTLHQAGLPGHCLKIEITESTLMTQSDVVRGVLSKFKAQGIQIAIDDFGTGYSSLAYLQSFVVDVLKIDQVFLANLEQQNTQVNIVKTIINLADALELEVIAEGIETSGQISLLRSLKCKYGQGYFIAKPLRPDEVHIYMSQVVAPEFG